MRQDLQLSFVDILGYILPGTILSMIVILHYNLFQKEAWEFYLVAIGIGYLNGHLFINDSQTIYRKSFSISVWRFGNKCT